MSPPASSAHVTDVVVVGAGVVGLAVARAVARQGREVVILEAAAAIGTGISARSSEVIHAGLYYPPGSLKARTCVAGRRALYDYCVARGVAHRQLGKLVVATTDTEAVDLEDLLARARANGVGDLRLLDGDEARALEPALRCTRALLSPSTGIVDSHGLLRAFEADARAAGAALALLSPVTGGAVEDEGLVLHVGGRAPSTLRCRALVNACGLDAQAFARRLDGLDARTIPATHYAKGSTFALRGPSPFARLVYPLAVAGGLGIHLTLDLAGRARFGPDVQWVDTDTIDYAFDETRAASFYAAVRRYWPALPDDALSPGTTGIRPKLGPAGAPAQDFLLSGPATHGVPGLVNLYGIESPGLTAALALADAVVEVLG